MSRTIKHVPARPGQPNREPRIATRILAGQGTPIIYFAGFGATMEGNKAKALAVFAEDAGLPLIRFDYQGVGASPGDGKPGTMTLWRDDALSVIDQLVEEQGIIVGSSMGAWIGLLAALARPKKIAALVLIACAADFTEPMRKALADNPDAKVAFPRSFIEDGRNHVMLEHTIEVDCPVTLIHAQKDETIPWQNSLRTATKLRSDEVSVHVRRRGDHRLSTKRDLEFMFGVIKGHLNK